MILTDLPRSKQSVPSQPFCHTKSTHVLFSERYQYSNKVLKTCIRQEIICLQSFKLQHFHEELPWNNSKSLKSNNSLMIIKPKNLLPINSECVCICIHYQPVKQIIPLFQATSLPTDCLFCSF